MGGVVLPQRTLGYVEDFIKGIQHNLTLGYPDDNSGFWISRRGEGTLFLDEKDRNHYTATVDRLVGEFAKAGDLSRRSVERYLQDALFHSLDIPKTRGTTFDKRVSEALISLRVRLTSPPLSYRCFVPVHGVPFDGLPFNFGQTRFVKFGESHQRQLMKQIGANAKTTGFHRLVRDLKKGELWGQVCAVVNVQARDFESAQVHARIATRETVDCVNFFHDLIPFNHGWLYLSSEGAPAKDLAPVISSAGEVLLPHSHLGPLGPFSLENLRKARHVFRYMRLLSDLSRKATPKSAGDVLLTSFRWAGRASVEAKREHSFLLFSIALEAAVLPEHNQELTYRLSLRVARLLGRSREQRDEIKKLVVDLYRVRSKIVHRGSYEVTDDELGSVRAITKRVLLGLLRRRSLWTLTASHLEKWLEDQVAQ